MKIDRECKACQRNLLELRNEIAVCLWCEYEEDIPNKMVKYDRDPVERAFLEDQIIELKPKAILNDGDTISITWDTSSAWYLSSNT